MPGRDHRGVKIATTAALQPGATAGLAWDFGLPQPPEMGVGVVPLALRRAWLAFLPARDLALDLSHGAPADGSDIGGQSDVNLALSLHWFAWFALSKPFFILVREFLQERKNLHSQQKAKYLQGI